MIVPPLESDHENPQRDNNWKKPQVKYEVICHLVLTLSLSDSLGIETDKVSNAKLWHSKLPIGPRTYSVFHFSAGLLIPPFYM